MSRKTKYWPDNPAKFSDSIIDVIYNEALLYESRVQHPTRWLDPFAGVGKGVDFLRERGIEAWGQEIEREWAEQCQYTVCGDSTVYRAAWHEVYDGVFTSPTYANRMRDHHNARDTSKRHTYKHYLGRDLSPNNTGQLAFNDEYRQLHQLAFQNCYHYIKPGGRFILNVSNHYKTVTRCRKGVKTKELVEVHVAEWMRDCLREIGFKLAVLHKVDTPRLGHGANAEVRTEQEWVAVFNK